METEKTCKRCQKSLPLSAFGAHKKRSGNGKVYDFRRNVCKPCYSAYEAERRGSYGEWTDRAKIQHAVQTEKRRAKRKLLPSGFTGTDWKAALVYFDHKCAYCGDKLTKAEQDHFIPVKLGGGYVKENIVPACSACNKAKRAKHPAEWLPFQPKGLMAYLRVLVYFATMKQERTF
jgi:5-methylcytosine-specific restriction endonuclease McrA